ncbi:hypothetical protein CK203_092551 [Vitis vinifera]|uniref:UspA domain-containing protein n=1 Tax=Vitis vinifera TaxID=29760 RepID=A0A438DHL1_VITVI|nr:hypothetical protein CK203_092551 [Vitis vinifera]
MQSMELSGKVPLVADLVADASNCSTGHGHEWWSCAKKEGDGGGGPNRESAAALQYAISHAMMEKDELILIQVGNPNSWRSTFSTFLKRPTPPAGLQPLPLNAAGGGDWDHLEAMKHACAFALPKVRVHIERVAMEGKGDKATTILHYCKLFSVDLLIVGQRRSLSTTILGSRRNGGPSRLAKATDTAEYLIENSKCTCVGPCLLLDFTVPSISFPSAVTLGDGVNQGFFFVSHLLVMELIICMYLDMVDSCPCQPPYVNEKAPKFNFPSNW